MNYCLSLLIFLPLVLSSAVAQFDDIHIKKISSNTVKLVTFDGSDGTTFEFEAHNAPGFCSMQADGEYNDASTTIDGGIVLRVRSSSPEYAGFRMVFVGNALSPDYACRFGGTVPLTNGCYKALFNVPPGNEFVDVAIPFSKFSDHWDPSTGTHITECADDLSVCPTEKALGKITQIQIMGEGVAGDFHLEVESIAASSKN